MDLAYTTSSRMWPWGVQQFGCREARPCYDPTTGQWIWPRVCIKQENNDRDKVFLFTFLGVFLRGGEWGERFATSLRVKRKLSTVILEHIA